MRVAGKPCSYSISWLKTWQIHDSKVSMIRKLIKRFFGQVDPTENTTDSNAPKGNKAAQLKVFQGRANGIDQALMSPNAIRVCDTLQAAGFEAYIVGGGVRDCMLGVVPKDFDVATNATPEQIKVLFRRAIIIGKRFRLVHVVFGREVIETSTFRALQSDAPTDEHGRVLRDNEFGSLIEDATRRDFTVNALYYDPKADKILDYHHGVADVKAKVLRMIGEPEQRYREDPVRMMRAVRFAAKLGFTIDGPTAEPVKRMADLLNNVPSARLFDETIKLLTSGHSLACMKQLRSMGLHHGLMPLLDVVLEQPEGERFVMQALTNTDLRVQQDKSISPSFLFATLLWPQVRIRWEQLHASGGHLIPTLHEAIDSVMEEQSERLAIQRRYQADMREIWTMQPRFERRNAQHPFRLLEHLRFRAAYDFMLLRCQTGETEPELGQWWTDFYDGDAPERHALLEQVAKSPNKSGSKSAGAKNKRRKRKPASSAHQSDGGSGDLGAS
jgi:poly(A) polymerase